MGQTLGRSYDMLNFSPDIWGTFLYTSLSVVVAVSSKTGTFPSLWQPKYSKYQQRINVHLRFNMFYHWSYGVRIWLVRSEVSLPGTRGPLVLVGACCAAVVVSGGLFWLKEIIRFHKSNSYYYCIKNINNVLPAALVLKGKETEGYYNCEFTGSTQRTHK